MIKSHWKLFLILFIAVVALTGTGLYFTGWFPDWFHARPDEEILLRNMPEIDTSKYNRLQFSINIDTGNTEGDSKTIKGTGIVEVHKAISHMYNLNVEFSETGYTPKKESWTDFSVGKTYENRNGGWSSDTPGTTRAIDNLVDIINSRNKKCTIAENGSGYTLSWQFDTDIDYLFGTLMSHYTEDLNLTGNGRLTAVFDKDSCEFQYFTVVISASNSEQAGSLLDAVFHWEVQNEENKVLSIPETIVTETYAKETGVFMTGGYDEKVNRMAETFIKAYGGTAETVKDDAGASMFWTASDNNRSATVNYMTVADPALVYEQHTKDLTQTYGKPAETTDEGLYFYRAGTSELVCATKGDSWYAEITITGPSDITQGELRKLLITYKSKIEL